MTSQRLAIDWEAVFDMSPIPTAMTDAEGVIIFVNQALCHLVEKLYEGEVSKEDRIGKHILSFAPEADREVWEKRYRDLLRGVPFHLPEYSDANIQGAVWEIWGNPIRDASGRIIGSVVMERDVTERVMVRKDEQKRAALDRARAEVLRMRSPEDLENVLRALEQNLRVCGLAFDDCSIHLVDDRSESETLFLQGGKRILREYHNSIEETLVEKVEGRNR